jgi:hypothetical protein
MGIYALREEAFKFWEHVETDMLVYGSKSNQSDLEIGRSVECVDWITKYRVGDAWIELDFVLLSQWNGYFKSIITAVPARRGNTANVNVAHRMTEGNDPVFIDIVKLVQLPKGIILVGCASEVRLKRIDDLDCIGGKAGDKAREPLVSDRRRGPVNVERHMVGRSCGDEQGKLPCEIVETGSQLVSKLSNQAGDLVGRHLGFNVDDIKRLLKIIIVADGVWIFPQFLNFPIQFVQMHFRPTNFNLCIEHPDFCGHRGMIPPVRGQRYEETCRE